MVEGIAPFLLAVATSTRTGEMNLAENGNPSQVDEADIFDRIVSHLVEQVGRANTESQPFQHFHIEQVFPQDIYEQILSNLPAKSCYRPFNIKRWKNDYGESTRDCLCLSEGELARIDQARRPFWESITRALESPVLQRAVYARLAEDIAIRLACDKADVLRREAFANVMLVRDYKDYRIKPHPDGQPRVVTMQIYLPRDGAATDLGTSLYTKQPLAYRFLGQSFKEAKRFPFKPNFGYAFAVNDCPQRQSFHGRELIAAKDTVRDSILMCWLSRWIAVGQKHAAAYAA
jgi:hypothetical protein